MKRLILPITIAICAGLVVACASTKKSPEDEQNQAKAVFDAMEDSTDRRHDALESTAKQLDKLLRDTDVPDADLDAVLSYSRDTLQDYQSEMLDHIFELRSIVNREQWQAILATPPDGDD